MFLLEIHLLQGESIAPTSARPHQFDSLVRFQLGRHRLQSSVKTCTPDPNWNEKFYLKISEEELQFPLSVNAIWKDLIKPGGETSLAHMDIELSLLPLGTVQEYPMQCNAGQILMNVQLAEVPKERAPEDPFGLTTVDMETQRALSGTVPMPTCPAGVFSPMTTHVTSSAPFMQTTMDADATLHPSRQYLPPREPHTVRSLPASPPALTLDRHLEMLHRSARPILRVTEDDSELQLPRIAFVSCVMKQCGLAIGRAPLNDMTQMAALAASRGYVVYYAIDPTTEQWTQFAQRCVQNATQEVLLYLSGYGTQIYPERGIGSHYMEAFVLPDQNAPCGFSPLTDCDLSSLLVATHNPHTPRITLISDTCHSGLRALEPARALRGVGLDRAGARVAPAKQSLRHIPAPHTVFLNACADNIPARQAMTNESEPRGTFTNQMSIYFGKHPNATFEQVRDHLKMRVHRYQTISLVYGENEPANARVF